MKFCTSATGSVGTEDRKKDCCYLKDIQVFPQSDKVHSRALSKTKK